MANTSTAEPTVRETTKPKHSFKEKLKRPTFYVVVVHNDPVTPRRFVVEVLRKFFDKNEAEATKIMLLAHNYNVGVVAKYAYDIAETKARQVNEFARTAGYPLFFSTEEA